MAAWTRKRRYIKKEDEGVKAEEKTDKKDDDRQELKKRYHTK